MYRIIIYKKVFRSILIICTYLVSLGVFCELLLRGGRRVLSSLIPVAAAAPWF
jgi:hypothetical protein